VINLFSNIGITEILIVAAVLIILFGGKKLPELAKGLAEAIKEFRKAWRNEDDKEKKDLSEK
jgi:sec-independent protein translocase protein TatA